MTTIKIDSSLLFKGRPGDPRLGEAVSAIDLEGLGTKLKNAIVVLGAPDDIGVQLNRGRVGAKGGPHAVREALYRFAQPIQSSFKDLSLIDVGNISVVDNIAKNHERAFDATSIVGASNSTLVAIGGGHDFAAPHALGFFSGVSSATRLRKFGVLNVDPHLDVRELENGLPNSGTAFRQILESKVIKGKNLVQFGARNGRNAKSHFNYCKLHKVEIHELDSVRRSPDPSSRFKACLQSLTKRTDKVAVTIDIDSCNQVVGASAAAVIGFSAWELCQFAYLAGSNKKVGLFELAELAPNLDPSGQSAKIGAEIVFHFILGFLERIRKAG